MQVIDSEGYLKVKLIGGPAGPFVPYTGATGNVDLGTHTIIAQNATISSSGSGNTATIAHSSGSGIGLTITKGGNGEGLYVNKTSGSGNAVTVIGDVQATILKITGGTSSQFLKANGSVDSSTYVPTTRTLTINGTTQDLSADRTFTISTGITIGTTAITSGTVGRVLFEGTGNVVQESANLFWDNTNGRLGIGGTPSAFKLDIVGTSSANIIGVKVRNTSTNGYTEINCYNNTGGDNDRIYFGVGGTATGDVYQNRGYFISSLALEGITFTAGKTTTGDMRFFTGGNNERLRIFGNGNIGINTTTDAGFKLDVNGTARVTSVTAGVALVSTWSISASYARFGHNLFNGGTTFGFLQQQTGDCFINGLSNFFAATNNNIFETNGAERMRITSTGNVLIGTTTNGASKLRLVGLPTSPAGLSSGDVWNNLGILTIV